MGPLHLLQLLGMRSFLILQLSLQANHLALEIEHLRVAFTVFGLISTRGIAVVK